MKGWGPKTSVCPVEISAATKILCDDPLPFPKCACALLTQCKEDHSPEPGPKADCTVRFISSFIFFLCENAPRVDRRSLKGQHD